LRVTGTFTEELDPEVQLIAIPSVDHGVCRCFKLDPNFGSVFPVTLHFKLLKPEFYCLPSNNSRGHLVTFIDFALSNLYTIFSDPICLSLVAIIRGKTVANTAEVCDQPETEKGKKNHQFQFSFMFIIKSFTLYNVLHRISYFLFILQHFELKQKRRKNKFSLNKRLC
jgi:hypothetical protein